MFILTENLHGGDGLAAPANAVLGGAHIVPGLLPGHRVKHKLVPGEIRVRSGQVGANIALRIYACPL